MQIKLSKKNRAIVYEKIYRYDTLFDNNCLKKLKLSSSE